MLPRLAALVLLVSAALGCTTTPEESDEPAASAETSDASPAAEESEAPTAPVLGAWHDLVDTRDGLLLVNGYPEDAVDPGPLELWRRVGDAWEAVGTDEAPSGRNFAGVAVDPGSGDVVLHGGLTPDGVSDETWVWDGAWRQVDGAGPGPRSSSSMAFDVSSRRTLLYGGDDGSEQFADTWAFDGASWEQVDERGPGLVRWPAAFETDPEGGVVLYGGHQVVDEDGPLAVGDTWVWRRGSWQEVPGATQPGPLVNAATVVHPTHGLLLVGGGDKRGREHGRVWAWTGTGWRAMPPDLVPRRQAFGAAYDADRAVVVLTGGLVEPGSTERHQDVWEWSGDPGEPAERVG